MRLLTDIEHDDRVDRFTAQLETALMARALAEAGALPDERVKALMHDWLIGTFNATAAGINSLAEGRGRLAWEPEPGEGYRLTWYAPTGLVCPLARVYAQPDGSFAALIVAGVQPGIGEAMAAAEWGIARLTC
jgi:hypothetical protein